MVSLSGRFSREGALLRDGYELWARVANESGGVRVGSELRPVQLLIRDDQSEPLASLGAVEDLVLNGASLLLGPHSNAITLASATAAERQGALMVAPDAPGANVYTRGVQSLVSILPTEDTLLHSLLEVAASSTPRARPIAVLGPDEPGYRTMTDGAKLKAAELSLDPPVVETYPLGARDVELLLDRLGRSRPRLLVIVGDADLAERWSRSVRELRLDTSMIAFLAPYAPGDVVAQRMSGLLGIVSVDWWSSALRASGPLFGSSSEFSDRFVRDLGYRPPPRAAAAAAAGLALQLAIERAASLHPMSVRAAFDDLVVSTFWGNLGWDSAGRNRAARLPVLQAFADGWRVVAPKEFASDRLVYPINFR